MTKIFKTPFGALGDKQEVPTPTQPDGSVSYEQGFGVDYQRDYEDPQAKDIPREGLNQLFYDVTKALGELQNLGYMQWQAGEYQAGDRVAEGGAAYKAVRTTSNKPPHADWDLIPDKNLEIISQSEAEKGLSTELSGWSSERVRQNAKKYTDSVAIGVGQKWVDVTSQRQHNIVYTNTTGRPILVSVQSQDNTVGGEASLYLTVGGVVVSQMYYIQSSATNKGVLTCSAIVPAGTAYSAYFGSSDILFMWAELR